MKLLFATTILCCLGMCFGHAEEGITCSGLIWNINNIDGEGVWMEVGHGLTQCSVKVDTDAGKKILSVCNFGKPCTFIVKLAPRTDEEMTETSGDDTLIAERDKVISVRQGCINGEPYNCDPSERRLHYVQLEPDKQFASVGRWMISTARFGVGCIAALKYRDDYALSISGETRGQLVLLIEVSSKWFDTKLDGSEDDTSNIEIALVNNRWGNVSGWGYRGTPGVVLVLDEAFLSSFIISKQLKVTERGFEKVSIELNGPKQVIEKLTKCFNAQ